MRFTPITPDSLVSDLAHWIVDLPGDHPAVGFDAAVEVGGTVLADSVTQRVRALGRPVLRASTQWWWRPASLRLELGRTDLDMLLYGWVDSAALRRELFQPLAPGGTGQILRRLRDPDADRSVRQARKVADPRAVVLLDGPFLLAAELPLHRVVHLQVSAGALSRALPPDRRWWLGAFERYRSAHHPAGSADVVISYDHPGAPAIGWTGAS